MIKTEKIGEIRKFCMARSILGRGWYFSASYWVDGLVVDTGCAHTVKELLSALEGLRVSCIVNTHSHEDHIGGNARLQAGYGVNIFAHPLALPVLEAPKERQPLYLFQRMLFGYPDPSQGVALGETLETDNYRFEVIPCPGHSPDHICLYEPERGWLFTGDAYVGGLDRVLRRDYDIWGIISSLKRIAGLDVELLFGGSGSIHVRPRAEILRKIDYLEELGARVLALHRKGAGCREIHRRLFERESLVAYLSQGYMSGKNLVRSYIFNKGRHNGFDMDSF